jgi:hypothetical protein
VTGATTLKSTLAVHGDTSLEAANLAIKDNAGVSKFGVTAADGNTDVQGTLAVAGASTLSSTLDVHGQTTIDGADLLLKSPAGAVQLQVANADGNVQIAGSLDTTGVVTVTGASNLNGGIMVNTNQFTVTAADGNVAAKGTLLLTGASTQSGVSNLNGGIAVNNNKFSVSSDGNAAVLGTLTSTGNVSVNSDKFIVTASDGNVAGAGNLSINTDKFVVASASGNTQVAGTMTVGGDTSIQNGFMTVARAGDQLVTIKATGSNEKAELKLSGRDNSGITTDVPWVLSAMADGHFKLTDDTDTRFSIAPGGLTKVHAGGLTVVAGGLTVTDGGLTVATDGYAVTGDLLCKVHWQ